MRVMAGIFALLATACSAQDGPGPILIETETVPLYPESPERLDVGELEFSGGLILSSTNETFGGLSALEVEGNRLLAISDSAYWFTGRLEFDDNGWLTGVSNTFYAPMLDENGEHLTGDRSDAEGLAPLGNGRFAVSFEREHRIWSYDISPDWSGVAIATPDVLPSPPGADRLRNNGGMEALAGGEGALLVGIEYPIIEGQPHTIWTLEDGGREESRNYAAPQGFGITGMTGSPNAYFVLERFYSRDVGNSIRIIGVNSQDGRQRVLASLEPGMTVDNFEGIAMGQTNIASPTSHFEPRLFIISDDNFNGNQRTLLLSFKLPSDFGIPVSIQRRQ